MAVDYQINNIVLFPYQFAMQHFQAISQEVEWNGRIVVHLILGILEILPTGLNYIIAIFDAIFNLLDPFATPPPVASGWPSLSKDLLWQVSTFLTPDELGRSIRVCKSWGSHINTHNLIWNWQAQRVGVTNLAAIHAELNKYQSEDGNKFSPQLLYTISGYASNITGYDGHIIEKAKQLFANPHPAIAFDREKWIQSIGDPGEVPPLPFYIYELLRRPCPFWPGKTIEETHILVLIPKTVTRIVDGHRVTVPLTLRTLDELLKFSNNGAGLGYKYIWNQVLQEHGDTLIEKSHWILMTNDLIPRSRNRSYVDQKQLVENAGYEVPSLLDAAASILLEHIRSGRRLFADNPWTYTRCQQTVRGHQSIVGGFAPGGLSVFYSYDDDDDEDGGDCGVSACKCSPPSFVGR